MLCLLRLAIVVVGLFSGFCGHTDLKNLIDLDHKLPTVLHFLQSLDALAVNLAKVLELLLEIVRFGSLEYLGRHVVPKAVKHDFFVQFALFGAALHQDVTNLLKLLFRHSVNRFLDDPRAVLLLAELAQI